MYQSFFPHQVQVHKLQRRAMRDTQTLKRCQILWFLLCSRIHLCWPNYLYLYSHDLHPLSYLLWLWTWTSKHRIEASPSPLQVVLQPIGIVGGLMTVTACNTHSLCSSSGLYLIKVFLWRILRTQHTWSRQCSMPGFNQIGHVSLYSLIWDFFGIFRQLQI